MNPTNKITRFSLRILLRWKVFFIGLMIVSAALLAVIAVVGANATLSPKRRSLEPWHMDILSKPDEYGIKVTSHCDRSGTPYLVCEPTWQKTGKKARMLRQELETRGIEISDPRQIRGTLMLLHGHKGCKEDHLPICERFCAAGFRCLCVDLPGHGKNPSEFATFGHTEVTRLLQLWQEFQEKHPDTSGPLGLFGVSQGAAIALQMAAHHDCPAAAVASVCSFTTLDQPIDASADHLPSILSELKPLTTRACALGIYCRSGFFPSEIRPLDAASQIRCPVFITHGKDDSFVPSTAAEQLYHAVRHQKKTLQIIEKAGHHNVLSVGSTKLYADLSIFFLREMTR